MEQSFEEKLQNLEQIVTSLERGDVALEDAITQFQNGMVLVKELKETLTRAEQAVVKMVQQDGTEIDFNPEQKAY